MAEQTVKSKPLYDESEEEKRRRLKAENLLNTPQARIVGDTLVGKAAGIPASEWDKRDASVASGNNPLMPTREMQPIRDGVMADAATKERYDASVAASSKVEADRAKQFSDAFNKYQSGVDADNKKVSDERRAAMTPEASKARAENFRNSIADREATNDKIDAELRYASDEERLARRNFRALKGMVRRGKFVDPQLLQAAAAHMADTSSSLGNSRNVGVRREAVASNLDKLIKARQEREAMGRYAPNPNNPYGTGSRGVEPSSGGLLAGAPQNQTTSFTQGGLNAVAPTLDDDEYEKIRKGLYSNPAA